MKCKIGQEFWDSIMFGDHMIYLEKWVIDSIDDDYVNMTSVRPKHCGYGYDTELGKMCCKEFEERTYTKRFILFQNGINIPECWKSTPQEAVSYMFEELEMETD